jgi:hypothetical protein
MFVAHNFGRDAKFSRMVTKIYFVAAHHRRLVSTFKILAPILLFVVFIIFLFGSGGLSGDVSFVSLIVGAQLCVGIFTLLTSQRVLISIDIKVFQKLIVFVIVR